VKRTILLRTIARAANRTGAEWRLVRDRGDHEVWSLDGVLVVVPRHREVNDMTALHIHLDLDCILGPRWWRR
jgi:mRNA interferase HicA